jgi:hypothetical protein
MTGNMRYKSRRLGTNTRIEEHASSSGYVDSTELNSIYWEAPFVCQSVASSILSLNEQFKYRGDVSDERMDKIWSRTFAANRVDLTQLKIGWIKAKVNLSVPLRTVAKWSKHLE